MAEEQAPSLESLSVQELQQMRDYLMEMESQDIEKDTQTTVNDAPPPQETLKPTTPDTSNEIEVQPEPGPLQNLMTGLNETVGPVVKDAAVKGSMALISGQPLKQADETLHKLPEQSWDAAKGIVGGLEAAGEDVVNTVGYLNREYNPLNAVSRGLTGNNLIDYPKVDLPKPATGEVGDFTRNVTEIAALYIGAGKFTSLAGGPQLITNLGSSAIAGFVSGDDADNRLSTLIQNSPLKNPLTQWLAGDDNDSELESRVKSTVDAVLGDLAFETLIKPLFSFVKGLRKAKSISPEEANKYLTEHADDLDTIYHPVNQTEDGTFSTGVTNIDSRPLGDSKVSSTDTSYKSAEQSAKSFEQAGKDTVTLDKATKAINESGYTLDKGPTNLQTNIDKTEEKLLDLYAKQEKATKQLQETYSGDFNSSQEYLDAYKSKQERINRLNEVIKTEEDKLGQMTKLRDDYSNAVQPFKKGEATDNGLEWITKTEVNTTLSPNGKPKAPDKGLKSLDSNTPTSSDTYPISKLPREPVVVDKNNVPIDAPPSSEAAMNDVYPSGQNADLQPKPQGRPESVLRVKENMMKYGKPTDGDVSRVMKEATSMSQEDFAKSFKDLSQDEINALGRMVGC